MDQENGGRGKPLSPYLLITKRNIMKKDFILVLVLICLLVACGNYPRGIQCETIDILDSTMVDINHYEIRKINVGEKITNKPMASQIVSMNGVDKYVMLDEYFLYVFDWQQGILEDSVSLRQCGSLKSCSGFNYINSDSIIIYDDGKKIVFLIDSNGNIQKRWNIPRSGDYTKWVSSVDALNGTRVEYDNEKFLFSGSILGAISQVNSVTIPVSECLYKETGKWKPVVYYPELYMQYNWGGYYMNCVYVAKDSQNRYLYSYPILDQILRYSNDFLSCDTMLMKSRYDKGLEEFAGYDSSEEDETNEIRYYISQTSYSNIIYDSYRNIYLRLAEHPLQEWSGKGAFCKPFSILVSNMDGEILSESSISTNYKKFCYYNLHVCKEGIVIAMENSDENNIYFACIKINK